MLIPKLKACSLHLLISVLIGLLAAFFVFSTWYPAPYAQLSGGLKLFFMILGVDIILGPLLTFIVFNPKKPKKKNYLNLLLSQQYKPLAFFTADGPYSKRALRTRFLNTTDFELFIRQTFQKIYQTRFLQSSKKVYLKNQNGSRSGH